MLAEYDRLAQISELQDFLLHHGNYEEGNTALSMLCQAVTRRNHLRLNKQDRPVNACPLSRLLALASPPVSRKLLDCVWFLLSAGAHPDHPRSCGCHRESSSLVSLIPHKSELNCCCRPLDPSLSCYEVVLVEFLLKFGGDKIETPSWYESHACVGVSVLGQRMRRTSAEMMYRHCLSSQPPQRWKQRSMERLIERGLIPLCGAPEFNMLLTMPDVTKLRACLAAVERSRQVLLESLRVWFSDPAIVNVLSTLLVAELATLVFDYVPGRIASLVVEYHLGDTVPIYDLWLQEELALRDTPIRSPRSDRSMTL